MPHLILTYLLAARLGAALLPTTIVVSDAITGAPVAGALVRITDRDGVQQSVSTVARGEIRIVAELPIRLRLTRGGYVAVDSTIGALAMPASASEDGAGARIAIRLTPVARRLEAVTVRAIRAESSAPVAQTIRTRAQFAATYSGQEMPMLLAALPSVTATSDAGVAAGYTYFRIRGLDQTRVNMTLDGVPLNEPEDQGFYSVNIADFANNVQSIQVQRGVGTSSNGTAPYAGSVNFESIALASALRGGELQVTGGSYDTRRVSVAGRTGLTTRGFAAYGRVSSQHTDGYRYDSGNDSRSAFASAGYFGARHVFKATALSGDARNEMAYVAADAANVERDPRTNPLTRGERDHFRQDVVMLSHSVALGADAAVTTTVFHNRLQGGYDVFVDPDMLRFNVGSRWTGLVSTTHLTRGRLTLDGGVSTGRYRRDHWLVLAPDPATHLYDNAGIKTDASAFLKASIVAGRATLFADAQGRTTKFAYVPDDGLAPAPAPIRWNFFNPKIGATVRLTDGWSSFASIGRNGREPARNDMFGGFDDIDATNASFIGPFDRVRPEYVTDGEAGVAFAGQRGSLRMNGYWMQFHDEITPIGKLSVIGLPLRKNVAASRRTGVELEASVNPRPWVSATFVASASANRIREYTDDETGLTYRHVEPLLTPRVQLGHVVQLRASQWLAFGANGRYVGRSYLANTGDERFVAPAWYTADLSATLGGSRRNVLVQMDNAFDARAYPGGYTDGSRSYYYVTAGRHFTVTARCAF